jgi:hypothetical protein
MRDICDVKVGIPLGNMVPSQVTVNNSYAMAIEPPSTTGARGGEQGEMLMASLQVCNRRVVGRRAWIGPYSVLI